MQFVRVSGYGPEDIEAARREGMTQFVEQAMCSVQDYNILPRGQQVAKNASINVFTNKQIAYDGILIFSYTASDGSPDSEYGLLSLNVTTNSGYCQSIWRNGYRYIANSYEYEANTAMYKVKKNAIITADIKSIERTVRVSGAWWLIHTPAEA